MIGPFAAAITNPYNKDFSLFRNPKERSSGKLLSLSDFLNLAKNSTSLTGVSIIVEVTNFYHDNHLNLEMLSINGHSDYVLFVFFQHAAYLREKQGLDVVKAVLDTLAKAGYSNATTTATKVMIQSTNSSVLIDFKKQSSYETVYKVEEKVGDILDSAIQDIKKFADAVVIHKTSVFPTSQSFITGQTKLVERLQKFQLPVYVEVFRNEFVSQPWDFFSDATVEINSHVTGAGINGTITEFPLTAARYKSKSDIKPKEWLIKGCSVFITFLES